MSTGANAYKGHGANTGGLQRHSVGDLYPYTVIRKGARAEQFLAFDMRTSNEGAPRRTYIEAAQDIASLRLRNMMHG
jgi:hypothetical protein